LIKDCLNLIDFADFFASAKFKFKILTIKNAQNVLTIAENIKFLQDLSPILSLNLKSTYTTRVETKIPTLN
jgi:hypothetical protein